MAYPNANPSANDAAQQATDAAKSIGRDAANAAGQAVEMAQNQLDSMTVYVRKNPLQATAIAAAVGFVFALVARR